jgi:hypothetical protein
VARGKSVGVVLPEVWTSPGVWLGLVGRSAEASDQGTLKAPQSFYVLYILKPTKTGSRDIVKSAPGWLLIMMQWH